MEHINKGNAFYHFWKKVSVLKEADLIRDTREGKFIFYEINTSVLEETLLWIRDLKGESNDVEKE